MVQLNDLDDDCLMQVLDRVSPNQLFKLQRLNKRLKRLATIKIGIKIKAIEINDTFARFSDCAHLDRTVARNQVLVLNPRLTNPNVQLDREPTKFHFFNMLSQCSFVKSIDFGNFCAPPCQLLPEVFRRCQQLECIKLIVPFANEDDWLPVLKQIGNRIVHFESKSDFYLLTKAQFLPANPSNDRLLTLIVDECPNIRQIKWNTYWPVTNHLWSKFKRLPNGCWISLVDNHSCCRFDEVRIFEDVVDEVQAYRVHWSAFGDRVDCLTKLKFRQFDDEELVGAGVTFAGLKRFNIRLCEYLSEEEMSCLVASRFPLLQEFRFDVGAGFTEADYDGLFQRMPSVRKLNINWNQHRHNDEVPVCLPGSAILWLKKLEIIDLIVWNIDDEENWQPDDFIQQLEHYVDDIRSLKKLTVDVSNRWPDYYPWVKTVESRLKQLKLKQNRVEINFINDC